VIPPSRDALNRGIMRSNTSGDRIPRYFVLAAAPRVMPVAVHALAHHPPCILCADFLKTQKSRAKVEITPLRKMKIDENS